MKLTTEQTNDMKTTPIKCTKNHSGNHTMVYDSNTGVFECAGCGHIRLAREIARVRRLASRD